MLELKNISKSYTTAGFTQVALDDVSVAFRDNEFVAILGPSGSGKTTMLNIVGGLDHYDSGDLVIDGISTRQYKDKDWDTFRNNRVGFVFQSYNLIPHQSILANVELALTLSGVGRKERRERAKVALERVGLGEHINKKPNQLSGGQMQRVAIARALINDPEIVLADEPTGALDSKTSVQIMDLLREIADERLVVMVTHNPELAHDYATRIVSVADGHIVGDTDPYSPTQAELAKVSNKQIRRARMSPLTALGLSFNNLMTKKGRTIMTAFAGSIGIIGIAAILALANGVNNYIKNVEEETLSSYPLQITSTSFDMTSMMTGMAGADEDDGSNDNSATHETELNDGANKTVREVSILSQMLSSVGSNDLESLKEFLDNGGDGINEYASGIEYIYNVTPQIYDANTNDGVYKINPDSSLSALGMGSDVSTNMFMSTMMSTDIFAQMPDLSLVEDQYDVVAGNWPTEPTDCVLVLTQDGSVNDFMLYKLGLRDRNELNEYITRFVNNEETSDIIPATQEFTYDDFLNLKMKVVSSADYYQYDSDYDVWVDKSGDSDYMKSIIDSGAELHISGIVQKKSDNAVLGSGLYYTSDLIDYLIDESSQTEIVKQQIANPEVNVFTGKTFAEEADENNDSSSFDMSKMFSIDESALESAFKFDEGALDVSQLDMSALEAGSGAAVAGDLPSMPEMDIEEIMKAIQSESNTGSSSGDAQGTDITAALNPTLDDKAAGEMVAQLMALYMKQVASGEVSPSPDAESIAAFLASDAATEIINSQISNVIKVDSAALEATIGAQTQAAMTQMASAMQAYMQQYMAAYMSQVITQITTSMQTQMQTAMQSIMSQLANNMQSALSIDTDAFANAFQFNMDESQLTDLIMSLMTSGTSSYDSNIAKLDYANKAIPYEIDIYAKTFDAKGQITDILDAYNTRMTAMGQSDKEVTYTDLVGTLMRSVTTIIDMISYMLIAFVSISLIVSSIMIGIITYISVLERRKEIGILRAVGASKKDVSRIFNAETIIEGLTAGLMGVIITALCCIPASAIVYAKFDVPNIAILPLDAAVILVVISVILSFIAGLIPARSASKKDPVEALRSE
jgi:ABC-type lipoprotein export system ATPase subunit/ABC-type antimicrobial peptide transport system permease subunit